MDCELNLKKFKDNRGDAHNGPAGFDFCFNYFQKFKDSNYKLADYENIQNSCAQLGQYLANWGMYRSGFINKYSMLVYERLIKEIIKIEWKELWVIDIDEYNDDNIEKLLNFSKKLDTILVDLSEKDLAKRRKPTITLKTKIMLGIFGNIPAFDRFFLDGFKSLRPEYKVNGLNKNSLNSLKLFYEHNKPFIDKQKIFTYDFNTKDFTKRKYSKSKIVDIIGFYETMKMTFREFKTNYDLPGKVVLLEGKRDVLDVEKDKLIALGRLLAENTTHILFRSGNATGADFYFTQGISEISPERLQVIIPYAGHRKKYNKAYHSISLDEVNLLKELEVVYHSKQNKKTEKLVDRFVAGEKDKYSVKAAYILRDTVKVIGTKDIKPASFAIFYDDLPNPMSGGTGHTMNVCRKNGVKFIDQTVWFGWI